ncbi:lipase 3-like [Achroia grisella]|uniref:lipase 3-like n=1 Tax=Achroia grisella TaxID=688607 RepID=UPI0027D22B77|nr:lipase 3-like [Achroia grisella]
MKTLIIILVIVLTKNKNVRCFNIFDVMTEKIAEFTHRIVTTFNDIKDKVKNLFQINKAMDKLSVLKQSIMEEKIRKSFHDFVEKTAAESRTESLEYLNLKSEPTALMSTSQLGILHGKRVESHVVNTKDGYLLTIHRISDTVESSVVNRTSQTVLLHHGLLGSSADWILLGPNKSLPYILSNSGYDVWMTNARGNYYSRGHFTKRVHSAEFWQFTFQEMGQYDLPAVIDYIRKIKNTSKPINYIGHSMGATALLVLLSTVPKYNDYLRIAILLAPLVFMANIQGPLKVLTSLSARPPEQLLKIIGEGEFIPSRKIMPWVSSKYCQGPKIYCNNPLLFLSGIPQEKAWSTSFIARLLYHVPAGGSTNTILHYGQLAESAKFHSFGDISGEFNLSRVSVPIAMFSSSDDWLATVPDVLKLYFSIKSPIDHYIIKGKNLSHTEFVWGSEADTLVFIKVIEFLENGLDSISIKLNEV